MGRTIVQGASDEQATGTPWTGTRAATIAGMACVWPTLFNQLLYPLTFTYNHTDSASVFSFHVVYSVLLIALTALFAWQRERLTRAMFSNAPLVLSAHLTGAVGIVLLSQCDFSNIASSALVGVGVALSAVYAPLAFLFWTERFAEEPVHVTMTDMALSFALFSLATAVRLAAGAHALAVSIACPIAAGAVAFALIRRAPATTARPSDFDLRTLPFRLIAPSAVFVLICVVGIALFNALSQLERQPPLRAGLYAADAVLFLALAALCRNRPQGNKGLSIKLFTIVSLYFIAAILLAFITSTDPLSGGTVPLIAAQSSLSVFIWMTVVRTANRMNASPVLPAALFLILIVALPRFASAALMYNGSLLDARPGFMTLFALTATAAVAAAGIIAAALMGFLSQALAHEAAAPDAPSDEPAFASIQATYHLTDREIDIARLAAKNLSAKQMAERLFLADSTVYTHLKRIYRKTGVHSKQELAALIADFIKRS